MSVHELAPSPILSLFEVIDRHLPIRVLSPDQILRRAAIAAAALIYGAPLAAASQHRGRPIMVWTCGSVEPTRLSALPGWNEGFGGRGALAVEFPDGGAAARAWSQVFGPGLTAGVIYPVLQVAGWRVALLVAGTRSDPILSEYSSLALDALARRTADLLRLARIVPERSARAVRPAKYESLRKRLARELHDGVGQPMSALLMRVQLARSRGFAPIDDLQAFEHAAHEAIEAARLIADGLRSAVPSFGHLASARRYAETILAAAGCRLTWLDETGTDTIEPRLARELAAVLKESVTNVVRHAHALEVTVRLDRSDGVLQLEVTDDGVGFAGGAQRRAGLGLLGNAERAERLGGHFAIEAGADGGTVVTLAVPCRSAVQPTMTGAPVFPVALEESTASLAAS